MAESKPPKDVLGLGQHLVRELGFSNQRDTLGRWMAHYVAELIDKAKKGSNPAERAKSRKIATETILKIWQHRTSLPGDAYPLKSYDNVLKVVDLLRPDDNPFKNFGHDENAKKNRLAALLFDRLSRLLIAILLMNRPSGGKGTKASRSAVKALHRKEQYILIALQRWSDILSGPKSFRRAQKTQGKRRDPKINLNEAALKLIDSTTDILVELQSELRKAVKKTVPDQS
jgi:hypothetical protein